MDPKQIREWERLAQATLPDEDEDADGNLYEIPPEPEALERFRAVAVEAVTALASEVHALTHERDRLIEETKRLAETLRGRALEGLAIPVADGYVAGIASEHQTQTLRGVSGETIRVPVGPTIVTLDVAVPGGHGFRFSAPLVDGLADVLPVLPDARVRWRIVMVRAPEK
jgi:hypothetical protein